MEEFLTMLAIFGVTCGGVLFFIVSAHDEEVMARDFQRLSWRLDELDPDRNDRIHGYLKKRLTY